MDTPSAILLTQIPIALAILLIAYEIHLMRKDLNGFLSTSRKKP